MNNLYPLKFKPVPKEKIWGGRKIMDKMGIDFSPAPNCGEVWMISGVPGNNSVVSNGFLKDNELNELVEVYMGDLIGEKVYEKYGDVFPVLIKIIDSNDYLSIQVHPDDQLAKERHNSSGKTEMWYVIDADPGAELISGFSVPVTKEEYEQLLNNKKLRDVLNFEQVKKGDVFYIPSGRIHALGPGILLAEIQQTSDITYRIYDWDRVDASGKSRELHTELALDAIDFHVEKDYRTSYRSIPNVSSKLVETPYFITNILEIDHRIEKNYNRLDSFVVYLCLEGEVVIRTNADQNELIRKGESILIPNEIDSFILEPFKKSTLLEVYIE